MKTEIEEAVVLAGGLGERLKYVISDTQKVMAPVKGLPFLHYVLSHLAENGIKRVILAVSHYAEHIINYFGNFYLGMTLVYSVEETPMGTGGALKQALEKCEREHIFLLNGDTYFDVDIHALAEKHLQSNGDMTLSVKKMTAFSRYGRVLFDEDGKVTSFLEKGYTAEGFINGGVYALKKSIGSEIPEGKCSFEKTVLEPRNVSENVFVSDGFFIDIGIPEDYFLCQTALPLSMGQNVFKAAFLDRDGVICREKHHLYRTGDFEFIPGVPEAMAFLKESGYLIIVITNQAGVAKGYYTEADVNRLHEYMRERLKPLDVLDAVYYCPYHPEAVTERYRCDSYERKPNPGMIERAVMDFAGKGIRIDRETSLLVGDTERDIRTGINARIGTKVLVRSGHEIPDETVSEADFIADSLAVYVKEMHAGRKD